MVIENITQVQSFRGDKCQVGFEVLKFFLEHAGAEGAASKIKASDVGFE